MIRPTLKLPKPAAAGIDDDARLQTPVRVALVEDQPEVRESWTRLLNSFPDFKCVCICASGEEALRIIPQEQPDVILMDIFLPRMSGIECTARLKVLLPQFRSSS